MLVSLFISIRTRWVFWLQKFSSLEGIHCTKNNLQRKWQIILYRYYAAVWNKKILLFKLIKSFSVFFFDVARRSKGTDFEPHSTKNSDEVQFRFVGAAMVGFLVSAKVVWKTPKLESRQIHFWRLCYLYIAGIFLTEKLSWGRISNIFKYNTDRCTVGLYWISLVVRLFT